MTCRIAAIGTLVLLSACSPSEQTPPPQLFKEQRSALDQAKAIESAQQQQAEEQQKAIEQQTQ